MTKVFWDLNPIWSDSWLCLLCCLLTSWSDLRFSMCASMQGVRCSDWRWFCPGTAVLSLVLVVAKCSAAILPLVSYDSPAEGGTSTTPLPGSSEVNAVLGHRTACQLIPEKWSKKRWCITHRPLTIGVTTAFLSALSSSDRATSCFQGSGHSLSE